MQRECQIDESVCCKRKLKPKVVIESKKIITTKKDESLKRRSSPIQVKKTSVHPIPIMSDSINMDAVPPPFKKIFTQYSPMNTPISNSIPALKNPIAITTMPSVSTPNIPVHIISKGILKKPSQQRKIHKPYNGFVPYPPYMEESFKNHFRNDNVNLSLDNLTAVSIFFIYFRFMNLCLRNLYDRYIFFCFRDLICLKFLECQKIMLFVPLIFLCR